MSDAEAPVSAGATDRGDFRDPRVFFPFLLITLIWGSTWIVIKDQLGPDPAIAVPPVWSVSYRFFIAGAAMMAIARMKSESLRLGRGGYVLAAMLGTFQFVVNYSFVYVAELYITSGLAAVVFALLVVPNAIFAYAFFGNRVSGRFVLGSAVAMAGVALLFVQEMRHSPGPTGAVLTGLGLVIIAVLAASISNVMQIMPAIRNRPVAPMLGWAMLYGASINAVFGWAYAGPPVFETRFGYWLGLLYLGVVASALAFWLYYEIIRKIGPAKAAYSSVLIPIIAMAFSTALEGYRWSALALAGGALAIAGLVIALKAGRAPPMPPCE
ncbi:MAG TPA: DMT family transporter [Allosphingosinicella sp.]|nr:DMT family transporter [Allosphingosinicella sp.]